MKRTKPLKRTAFKRKAWTPRPAKQMDDYTPKPRATVVAMVDTSARMVVSHPKWEPVRHEGYRKVVASLRCIKCTRLGWSQAAHPNTGKGLLIKTDDRECFPLCTDSPGVVGCHTLFDQGAMFPKEQRRAIEPRWGAITRGAIRMAGRWPADLAPWPEDEEVTA